MRRVALTVGVWRRWLLVAAAICVVLLVADQVLGSHAVAASSARAKVATRRASVIEYSVPTDPQTTVGPDHAVWFVDYVDSLVGRISGTGAVTEYRAPRNVSPQSLTTGPDGALWITDVEGDLVRMTTTGRFTKFPLPDHAVADEVTAGPDGSIWFTVINRPLVGRMTPAGRVTLFRVDRSGHPGGPIVAGPDGALWFGEYQNGAMGRITTRGRVTLYRITGISSRYDGRNPGPLDIAVGPDHAMWFTDETGIGRITTSGAQRSWRVTRNGIETGDIATGADGALWFTNGNGFPWVGRITTSGASTLIALPGGVSPDTVTALRDGTIWISSNTSPGPAIVRVTTSIAPLDTPGRGASIQLACHTAAETYLCTAQTSGLTTAVSGITATLANPHRRTVARGETGAQSATGTALTARIISLPLTPAVPAGRYRLTLIFHAGSSSTMITIPEPVPAPPPSGN